MTESTPQAVRSYLAALAAALEGTDAGVRREILHGVSEELTGLDDATAAQRIAALGDPAFIAAEARSAAPAATPAAASAVPRTPPVTERGWYIVAAGLLLALGWFLIPVLGSLAGLVMVWASGAWRRWEKWLATLAVPVLAGAVTLVVFAIGLSGAAGSDASGENPLVPGNIDLWTLLVTSGLVLIALGPWLIVRALRRARQAEAA